MSANHAAASGATFPNPLSQNFVAEPSSSDKPGPGVIVLAVLGSLACAFFIVLSVMLCFKGPTSCRTSCRRRWRPTAPSHPHSHHASMAEKGFSDVKRYPSFEYASYEPPRPQTAYSWHEKPRDIVYSHHQAMAVSLPGSRHDSFASSRSSKSFTTTASPSISSPHVISPSTPAPYSPYGPSPFSPVVPVFAASSPRSSGSSASSSLSSPSRPLRKLPTIPAPVASPRQLPSPPPGAAPPSSPHTFTRRPPPPPPLPLSPPLPPPMTPKLTLDIPSSATQREYAADVPRTSRPYSTITTMTTVDLNQLADLAGLPVNVQVKKSGNEEEGLGGEVKSEEKGGEGAIYFLPESLSTPVEGRPVSVSPFAR